MATTYRIEPIGSDGWQVAFPNGVTLAADGIGSEKKGRPATVTASYNGVTQPSDRVSLAAAGSRQKFIKNLSGKGVPLPEDADQALDALGKAARLAEQPSRDTAEQGRSEQLSTILDEVPASITRPLCIVQGHAYAATWVCLSQSSGEHLVVVRDDGSVFCDVRLKDGNEPLSALGFSVQLAQPIHPSNRWQGRGVKAYLEGRRPDPATVFHHLIDYFHHHLRFVRSLGDQSVMCELMAAYTLHTYMLEAFNVASYLWFHGERGSGKTWALKAQCQVSFLGEQLLAASSVPALRDLSDYGGAIGLDDAENVTKPEFDDDKRALLLSGNQRGARVTVKEPGPNGKGWVPRWVNVFGPRMFSSIRNPDATLASRCIQVPMCRSMEHLPDPTDIARWPIPRAAMVDDLWALALASLCRVEQIDREISRHTSLVGRALQPWSGVLTVAKWLDTDGGVTGVFDRLAALSQTYQHEREDLESDDPTRMAIHCLDDMLGDESVLVFKTAELSERINAMARGHDLAEEGKDFTNVFKIGKMLHRLRMDRPANLPGKRRWRISRGLWQDIAVSYGVSVDRHQAVVDADSEVFR